MRNIFKYIYVSLILAMVSCSESSDMGGMDPSAEGSASVSFELVSSRATDLDTDYVATLLKNSVLKIYDNGGLLIRRYGPVTECPPSIALVAGDYVAKLDIGSGNEYTLADQDMSFYGESAFKVEPYKQTAIDLECNILNTKVTVSFDDSLEQNLEPGYTLTVAAADAITDDMYEENYSSKLSFDSAGAGYITAKGGKLVWRFEGVIVGGEKLSVSGTIAAKAVAGGNYPLNFKYDKYLKLDKVMVDTSTDDHDDHFSFSPQPQIVGSGFDVNAVQLKAESYEFNVSGLYELEKVKIGADELTIPAVGETATQGAITYTTTDIKSGVLSVAGSAANGLAVGESALAIVVTDVANGVGSRNLTIAIPGVIGVSGVDYWSNSAVVTLCSGDANSTFSYGEYNFTTGSKVGEWCNATLEKSSKGTYIYEAKIAPEWTTVTPEKIGTATPPAYSVPTRGGLWAGKSYMCELVSDGVTYASANGTFPVGSVQTIPGGDMNNSGLSCFGTSNGGTSTWGSGNNSNTKNLCKPGNVGGAACAKLQATEVNIVITKFFAAGNLFYGQFVLDGTKGTVSFGQPFSWTARPTSLKLKYAAVAGGGMDKVTINGVDHTKDRGRIYIAIVDWTKRHTVTSGSGSPSGTWDPELSTYLDNDPTNMRIIGYGSHYIDSSTPNQSQLYDLEIPIRYYDTVTKPSKNYTILISCATSAYGDFLKGSTSSLLYVDDFTFGYDIPTEE